MEQNKLYALLFSYYLSRFDTKAYRAFGCISWNDAYEKAAKFFCDKPNNIKNMRDTFDPYFGNDRKGWHQNLLSRSRQNVYDLFQNVSFEAMTEIFRDIFTGRCSKRLENMIMQDPAGIIQETSEEYSIRLVESADASARGRKMMLIDLGQLYEDTQKKYRDNFSRKDVTLSEIFKEKYGGYLRGKEKNIEYQTSTAIMTSSERLETYVPNQCFVMASYAVDLQIEILRYAACVNDVLQKMNCTEKDDKEKFINSLRKKPKEDDVSANEIRTANITRLKPVVKKYFINCGEGEAEAALDTDYLVRFLTDEDWWHGSKAIYRTNDFYYSPILSVFNLVNASGSYVAEIVNDFANTLDLLEVSRSIIAERAHDSSDTSISVPTSDMRKTGGHNLIIYGAPGTGKSRYLEDTYGQAPLTERVVFHPEYTYFDFVGSYKPVPVYKDSQSKMSSADGSFFDKGEPYVDYCFVEGPFTKVLATAWRDPGNMHTLLIEELNRADAAAVFGQIFQLLDRDEAGTSEYRVMPSVELRSYLIQCGIREYIKDGIAIPSNMNIVATMNSADQCVNILDAAFKRRWKYKYMRIQVETATHKNVMIFYAQREISWGILVMAVNEKLKDLGTDEDRLIGPYFIGPREIDDPLVLEKLLLYLWDDVLRHNRAEFNDAVKSFSDLVDHFKDMDVLSIGRYISPAVTIGNDDMDDSEEMDAENDSEN